MKYQEIESLDPLLRIIDVTVKEGETIHDIFTQGRIPQVFDKHPGDDTIYVYNVTTEISGRMRFRTKVRYRPMPKAKDPKPEGYEGKLREFLDEKIIYLDDETIAGICRMAADMQALPRKEVISIQPGDVVVARFTEVLSRDRNDRTEKAMAQLFPHNSVLILDNGDSLEVYREQGKDDVVNVYDKYAGLPREQKKRNGVTGCENDCDKCAATHCPDREQVQDGS